jgi:hypothetical protein
MTTLHGIPIEVGDKVWSSKNGWKTVHYLDDLLDYSILVEDRTFREDGKEHDYDLSPSLFWQPQEFNLTKPLPVLKTDDKVLVWDEGTKYKRHFSHFNEDGKIEVFFNGYTSWSSDGNIKSWDNYELVEGEDNENL